MLRQSFLTTVVGQNVLLREGLVSILRDADFRVPDATCLVSDADMSLCKQLPILMIVAAGSDQSATVEQIKLFKDNGTNGSIVVVADRFRLNDVISAFHQGAKAYFLRDVRPAAFIQYLELVMMGEKIVPPEILLFILNQPNNYQQEPKIINSSIAMNTRNNHVDGNNRPNLSNREKIILQCLITGDSNKTIARKINIAEATVKVHIKAILCKVRVKNRTQAAIWAMRNDSTILPMDHSSSEHDVGLGEPLVPWISQKRCPLNNFKVYD